MLSITTHSVSLISSVERPMRNIIIVAALVVFTTCGLLGFAGETCATVIDTGNVSSYATQGLLGVDTTDKYDITFRQASLREALQFLAWVANINIMIPEGLEGVVNVNFSELTIGAALNSIIRANALEYTIEGSVMRIGKEEAFKASGEDLKTHTFRLRFAPAPRMAEQVGKLLSGRGAVIADERTNSVIVRELPSNIDNVMRFIEDVDLKDTQVLIESKILEATRAFGRSLGIQWGVTRGAAGDKVTMAGFTTPSTNSSGSTSSSSSQQLNGRNVNVNLPAENPTSGLLLGMLFGSTNIDVQLLAAEQRGDAYIISDPSIVTSNGNLAKIRSGATLLIQGTGEINIGTGSNNTSGGGSGLQEIETGIELTVTPQITMGSYVKLNIKAETSQPDFARAIQGIPVIVDNTATTEVLVKDGETTVIGGLSRYQDSTNKKRVPFLHRVPLIGNLFKSKDRKLENGELMVFIKPSIIRHEGIRPAQARIRDVERRQESMYLAPMSDPQQEAQKELKKVERVSNRKGNKYVR